MDHTGTQEFSHEGETGVFEGEGQAGSGTCSKGGCKGGGGGGGDQEEAEEYVDEKDVLVLNDSNCERV